MEKNNFNQRMLELEREIRDLKTAQTLPGFINMHIIQERVPEYVCASWTPYTWTIHFAGESDGSAPIISILDDEWGAWSLMQYDTNTDTQELQYVPKYQIFGSTYTPLMVSSRAVSSITPNF